MEIVAILNFNQDQNCRKFKVQGGQQCQNFLRFLCGLIRTNTQLYQEVNWLDNQFIRASTQPIASQ